MVCRAYQEERVTKITQWDCVMDFLKGMVGIREDRGREWEDVEVWDSYRR